MSLYFFLLIKYGVLATEIDMLLAMNISVRVVTLYSQNPELTCSPKYNIALKP